jgi:hypothetical protein
MNGIFSIISNLFPFVLSSSKDSERVLQQLGNRIVDGFPIFPDTRNPEHMLQRRREQVIRQTANVVHRFPEGNHIRVFHGHIEEINLMGRLATVEDALLND